MDTLIVIDTVQVALTEIPSETESILYSLFSFLIERVLPVGITALIAFWLALRKFKTEKYWELRLEAYNELVNALEEMFSYVDAKIEHNMSERILNDDEQKSLAEKWKTGREYVRKAKRIGRLLLSESALEIVDLDKRFKVATKGIDENDWFSQMDAEWSVLRSVINELITQSKKDLGLKI